MSTVRLSAPALDPSVAAALDTPVVVIDLDRCDAAIERMATFMADRGIRLRPHAKTHKSLAVGRRQLAAGADGLTVATLGEAEVFADGGIDDLFIAYPLLAVGPKAARLAALAQRARLRVGIDSMAGARAIRAAVGDGGRVEVLVEVDTGGRRTGVAPEAAGRLAAEAAGIGLSVIGVFTHGGHAYAGPAAAEPAGEDERVRLAIAAEGARTAGVEPRVVSAGSTPSARSSAGGMVTEERPGTYVYGDRQVVALGAVGPADVAAGVAATVVSVDRSGRRFTVDAGAKVLGKDVAPYLVGHGEIPALDGAVITRVNDHHGVVESPENGRLPDVGEVVIVIPNHICPVVNLVDEVLVVQGGQLVDRWPVDARGRNG